MHRRVIILIGVLLASLTALPLARADQPALSPSEKVEMTTLRAQLTDPSRAAQTRREAATLLLTRNYPQATALLRDVLTDEANQPAQLAVAEAIASSGQTQSEFIRPLLAMMASSDAQLRAAAAGALAMYRDATVMDTFARILQDKAGGNEGKLVVVGALQRVLDKRAVELLVGVLDDPDEPLRNAAADALVNLTNLRNFGRNGEKWKQWWAANKTKPQGEWLADLSDNLVKTNLQLDRENAELRKRLAAAMGELYGAAPAAGKDALLTDMLKDPAAEVRLGAAKLMQQRLTSSQPLPDALKIQVRSALTDPEPAVRGAAAVLLATIGGQETVQLLLDRLEVEPAGECREGLYQALGTLGERRVAGRVIDGVNEKERRVAAAAAAALSRMAEKNVLTDADRTAAAETLRKRYLALAGPDMLPLRDALLSAMATLKDKSLSDLMVAALKDPSAAIRLGAVRGLQSLAIPETVTEVAKLTGDSDRGVRLAAITAVGGLGGPEYVEAVLARTDSRVEAAPAVRTQAWTVVMAMLVKAEPATLAVLADRLAQRPDSQEYLISVLKLWAERLPEDNVEQWTPVRQRLGEALFAATRPAEAAGELSKVYAAMCRANDPRAREVHLKLLDAMLAADDAAVAEKIAQVQDNALYASAMLGLRKRLDELKEKKDWTALMTLCQAAQTKLDSRLSDSERRQIASLLQEAQKQQKAADEQRVVALLAKLTGADDQAKQAAAKDLAAMNSRAAPALVAALRNVLSAPAPDAAAEKAILDVLASSAPELKGYNPAAEATEKLKTVAIWQESCNKK